VVESRKRSDYLDLDSRIGHQLQQRQIPAQVPRDRLADKGLHADLAYQLVHDHLMLDGNASLNLARFVDTWMEPKALQLMQECAEKNMIDKDEYPQTAELEERCLRILAQLWNAADCDAAAGTSTTGSSEGCMLGGMVLKWHWRQKRHSLGLSEQRPNLVMGTNTQICWDKFCAYFDVEARQVPITPER
jgi:glutamate decarboxylase